MKLRLLFLLLLLSSIPLFAQLTSATDGIPDNCENPRAEFYRENVIARYEPQNQTLVLVDWTSGETLQILEDNLEDTLIRGWSWNCRYLATATASSNQYDTVVYDTHINQRVGSIPDAQVVPHTITWDLLKL